MEWSEGGDAEGERTVFVSFFLRLFVIGMRGGRVSCGGGCFCCCCNGMALQL